jgi:hypothetical protein
MAIIKENTLKDVLILKIYEITPINMENNSGII